jgi:L-ribulose-5-phosphate 4-epimerase
MLEELKQRVYQANMDLVKNGLVLFTWGNASGMDKDAGLFVIKPSGVSYDVLRPEDMVVVDLKGDVVEGKYRPSSDTATHLEIYKHFPSVGGIVHTHSTYATSWAQAGRSIPCYGTTQADYFYGDIPCTRSMTVDEIQNDYEKNTGLVICETFRDRDITAVPGVICVNHGPFAFGKDPAQAVYHATVLEQCAKMASLTEAINPYVKPAQQAILDKHYLRKHGKNAYYGQKST